MLSESEFLDWAESLGLHRNTVERIRTIRSAPPSRPVSSSRRSAAGRYPSRKMGVTIQFESRTVELPSIYMKEHDPDVLEFYDQPPPFQLRYKSANGKALGPVHTPDFFVIARSWAGWEEWKSEDALIKLGETAPNRYIRTDSGWRCPPGEEVAQPLGLEYRLRSDAELNPAVVRNLRFLEDYLHSDAVVPASASSIARALVTAMPGISVRDLILRLQEALGEMGA